MSPNLFKISLSPDLGLVYIQELVEDIGFRST